MPSRHATPAMHYWLSWSNRLNTIQSHRYPDPCWAARSDGGDWTYWGRRKVGSPNPTNCVTRPIGRTHRIPRRSIVASLHASAVAYFSRN